MRQLNKICLLAMLLSVGCSKHNVELEGVPNEYNLNLNIQNKAAQEVLNVCRDLCQGADNICLTDCYFDTINMTDIEINVDSIENLCDNYRTEQQRQRCIERLLGGIE